MRFIVTGGAGFIGSNIVRRLNRRGWEDIVVVDHLNHPAKQDNLDGLKYRRFFDKGEFRARLRSGALEHVDAVFHLGACSSTTESDEAYLTDNNYTYTRELCQWSLDGGVRFIYASSAATYGDGSFGYSDHHPLFARLKPLNLYGRSKLMFDRWALDSGALERIAGVRYFNVFGPGEDHKGEMRSMVNKAFGQVKGDGIIRLFRSHRPDFADGEQVRDFIYVDDAVDVTLFFLDNPQMNGVYNCGTGRARSWNDLARAVFAAMDKPPNICYIDMPEAIRERYQYHTAADMTKLRAAGYAKPFTSLEDAVGRYRNADSLYLMP